MRVVLLCPIFCTIDKGEGVVKGIGSSTLR
jgi:hypothetical protein